MKQASQYRTTVEFGTSTKNYYSYVFITGKKFGGTQMWLAKVLVMFHLKVRINGENNEYWFLQYLECTSHLNEDGLILGCGCLRSTIGDEVDDKIWKTLHMSEKMCVDIREWYDGVYIRSVTDLVRELRYLVKSLSLNPDLPWHHHRFFIKCFFRSPSDVVLL